MAEEQGSLDFSGLIHSMLIAETRDTHNQNGRPGASDPRNETYDNSNTNSEDIQLNGGEYHPGSRSRNQHGSRRSNIMNPRERPRRPSNNDQGNSPRSITGPPGLENIDDAILTNWSPRDGGDQYFPPGPSPGISPRTPQLVRQDAFDLGDEYTPEPYVPDFSLPSPRMQAGMTPMEMSPRSATVQSFQPVMAMSGPSERRNRSNPSRRQNTQEQLTASLPSNLSQQSNPTQQPGSPNQQTNHPHTPLDFTGLLGTLLLRRIAPSQGSPQPDESVVGTYKPGGYPEEIFLDLTEEEQEQTQCSVCYMQSREPRQCTRGHLFCAPCIYTWTVSSNEGRTRCPVCRSPGRYRPNFKVERILAKKKVKCTDCEWTGQLQHLKQHQKQHQPNDQEGKEEPVFPPVISAVSIAPAYVPGVTRSSAVEEAINNAPSRLSYHRMQRRIADNQDRVDQMMGAFSERLQRHRHSLDNYIQEREERRLESLREVENLGQRLNQVGSNLMMLMENMQEDQVRYQSYIEEEPHIPSPDFMDISPRLTQQTFFHDSGGQENGLLPRRRRRRRPSLYNQEQADD